MSRRRRRPVLLAIVAWLLMIGGAGALVGTALMMDGPNFAAKMKASPVPFPVAWVFLCQSCFIFCGLFLLKGVGWMRWVLLATIVAFTLLDLAVWKNGLDWKGASFHLVAVVACFLPKANAWFAKVREEGRG